MRFARGVVLADLVLAPFLAPAAVLAQPPAAPASRAAAEAAIGRALDAYLAAWNAHDATAFAAVFAEDADFANARGIAAHGRAAIRDFHAPRLATYFSDSRQTITGRTVRFVRPDVAAVDARWEMTGARTAAGVATPFRSGVISLVMTPAPGDASRWEIVVFHNYSDDPAPQPPRDTAAPGRLMTARDLAALSSRPPDRRVAYGPDSSQYGELRLPTGPGPHPVAVLVHGGCFKAAYATASDLSAMSDDLRASGIATWNVEYRRLGEPGGGWPGTYQDVGRAVDHVRALAPTHRLDLGRVVIVGHSAGGHLAMWAAARARLPAASPLYQADPLPIRGVVDLAGPVDLTANIAGYERVCGDTVVTALMGGTPAAVPERYAHASPARLLPLGVPQVLVWGEHEDNVPRPLAEAYARAAASAGDSVRLVVIPGAGHFEIASPRTSAWPHVSAAVRSLLDGKLPPDGASRAR